MDGTSDQIGERLRQARESAGLIVDDIVFQTRIPKSVVIALEDGDFSVFSSPTYARSFLSQYSSFLNVDARLWIDALEPVAYLATDAALPPWQDFQASRPVTIPEQRPSGSWFAGICTLALSCGLVYVAIKGYGFLEHRYGGETAPLEVVKEPVGNRSEPSPPGQFPANDESRKQTAGLPGDAVTQPPPRAIIVR